MSCKIIHADVRAGLRQIPAKSVHMVITSPPYYGLRDYGTPPMIWGGAPGCRHEWGKELVDRSRATPGVDGSGLTGAFQAEATRFEKRSCECRRCGAWRGHLGLEPVHDCLGWARETMCSTCYICHMREVFARIGDCLRDDGVCFVNMGDGYAGDGGAGKQGTNGQRAGRRHTQATLVRASGLKSKDMMLMPQRLALALQVDGWWVRQDIVWEKPSCMPSSVRDRCTTAHEYLWILSKSKRYFYDQWAIAEPSSPDTHARMGRAHGEYQAPGQDEQRGCAGYRPNTNGGVNPKAKAPPSGWDTGGGHHHGKRGRYDPKQNESFAKATSGGLVAMRNRRSVWRIPSEPFSEAHFATFPTKLVEPCILAGTSEHGCCPNCGAPWRRIIKRGALLEDWKRASGADSKGGYNGHAVKDYEGTGAQNASEVKARILEGMRERITVGWQPTCKCDGNEPVPATVLDPFGGSGTVGLVANRLQRNAILIELGEQYVEMGRKRITDDAPLLARVEVTAA